MTVASYKSGLAWLWPSVASVARYAWATLGHTTLQWAKQLFNQGQEFGVGPEQLSCANCGRQPVKMIP